MERIRITIKSTKTNAKIGTSLRELGDMIPKKRTIIPSVNKKI
jgi:hypothetical protein